MAGHGEQKPSDAAKYSQFQLPGPKKNYREIVFVVPEKIDDFRALELAREIANKIQSELKYPGEIKVNVIREIRAVEYAR